MRGSKQDLPIAYEDKGVTSRQAEWGDFHVALETIPARKDSAPIFEDRPGGRCQCPHWGYTIKGRFAVQYQDREEVINAGDAYYLAPGHTCRFDEDTEVVEFSPKGEYQKITEMVSRTVAGTPAGA